MYGFSKRTVGTVVVLSAVASDDDRVNPQDAQVIASSLGRLFFGLLALSFSISWIWSSYNLYFDFIDLSLEYSKMRSVLNLD